MLCVLLCCFSMLVVLLCCFPMLCVLLCCFPMLCVSVVRLSLNLYVCLCICTFVSCMFVSVFVCLSLYVYLCRFVSEHSSVLCVYFFCFCSSMVSNLSRNFKFQVQISIN